MGILQLNPQLPLVTPKGNAQAVAVIDYSEEHDLKWVCILDDGGAIWTFPNKDVRGFANPTMGRVKAQAAEAPANGAPTYLSERFCEAWLSAPSACAMLLNTALDPTHMRAAAIRIEEGKVHWSPPEYMRGASFGPMLEDDGA